MEIIAGVDDAALQARVLRHYYHAAPLIDRSFAGAPIVYANYPEGLEAGPHFHVTPYALTATKLEWAVHRFYAVEFHSWAPLPADEDRLRFARILLTASPALPRAAAVAGAAHDGWSRVREAALALRALLAAVRLDAIPLADGDAGLALWIPLADTPHAVLLRAWLHRFAAHAVAAHPSLLSTEPNTHDDGRVHVHVSSNAPGHFSALPYSLRGSADLPVCTPLAWDELNTVAATVCTAETFPQRLAAAGDLFAERAAALAHQRFSDAENAAPALHTHATPALERAAPSSAPALERTAPSGAPSATPLLVPHGDGHTPEPRGHIINAAIEILDDGKPRTADELLAEALKRKLVPPQTQRKYVYSALIEYIARQLGRGRKPPIVQDQQKRFRINEPPDDWPDIVPLPQPAPDAAAQALCDRLESTASGDDPTAFEIAACDAFAHLGFLTQHLGQRGQPDGIADAILGPLGYRVMLECKTAQTIVNNPDAAEVARFMERYGAQYGVLIGPAFSDELELLQELQTHKVGALAVPDLQTLLHIGANPLEVRRVLVPGYASDVIGDVLWERRHGSAKRVATVAAILRKTGWQAQLTAAQQGGPADAPRLTIDAAMLLVDEALHAAGSTQACTREEVAAAFTWLSNPVNATAVMDGDALVITADPEDSDENQS